MYSISAQIWVLLLFGQFELQVRKPRASEHLSATIRALVLASGKLEALNGLTCASIDWRLTINVSTISELGPRRVSPKQ